MGFHRATHTCMNTHVNSNLAYNIKGKINSKKLWKFVPEAGLAGQ